MHSSHQEQSHDKYPGLMDGRTERKTFHKYIQWVIARQNHWIEIRSKQATPKGYGGGYRLHPMRPVMTI